MKRLLFAFSLLLIFQACKTHPVVETYQIKGKIKGFDQKEIVLSRIGKNLDRVAIDTVIVKDSTFTFTIPKQTPDLAIISIPQSKKSLAVIIGDGNINIKADVYNPFNSDITGSTSLLTKKFFDYQKHAQDDRRDGQKIMQKYRTAASQQKRDSIKSAFEKWRSNAEQYQYTFINNNKNILGLIVMQSLISAQGADFKKIKEAFNQYPDDVRKLNLGKAINTIILTKGATEIGGQAPNFTGSTPDGKQLSLTKAMGKVTLIDFWASWCRPCRAENPYVVQIYNKYKNQGFVVIGVSLDKNKMAWERAIKDDGLVWQHVSNLKFWQEPIAKLYGITAIPQTFLIDAKGVIRAKNLRREQLEAKVKELLNE